MSTAPQVRGAGLGQLVRPPRLDAKPGPYVTTLTPEEEPRFQQWVQQNSIPWQDTPKADYDMRGYWQKYAQHGQYPGAVNPSDKQWHYTDEFKTPYHRLFSNESMYATPDAPHWEGNDQTGWRLIGKNGMVLHDESVTQ